MLTACRGKLLCLDGRETTCELISLLDRVKLKLYVGQGNPFLKRVSPHAPALAELTSFRSIFKAVHQYEGVLPLSPVLF